MQEHKTSFVEVQDKLKAQLEATSDKELKKKLAVRNKTSLCMFPRVFQNQDTELYISIIHNRRTLNKHGIRKKIISKNSTAEMQVIREYIVIKEICKHSLVSFFFATGIVSVIHERDRLLAEKRKEVQR